MEVPMLAPTARTPRPGSAPEYSGAVIVRLAPEFAATPGDSLLDARAVKKAPRLAALLREWNAPPTRRVVRAASPAAVARLEARAADAALPPLRSLNAYWRIDARKQEDRAEELVKQLEALPEVEHAYRELAATDPVVNAADDVHNALQTYLDAAPTGIDARWAWTQTAGDGAGIAVIDLEQGWIPTHEDLAAKSPTLIHGDNRHGVGTATWGTTGPPCWARSWRSTTRAAWWGSPRRSARCAWCRTTTPPPTPTATSPTASWPRWVC
jgi:serine protease